MSGRNRKVLWLDQVGFGATRCDEVGRGLIDKGLGKGVEGAGVGFGPPSLKLRRANPLARVWLGDGWVGVAREVVARGGAGEAVCQEYNDMDMAYQG